jgi:hypothetical protein
MPTRCKPKSSLYRDLLLVQRLTDSAFGKCKKNTQPSLDEEAIDETDNAQEEEEEQNTDDEGFISDGEHDSTGAEQRAMDVSHEQDSGTELEQFHDAGERVSTRKKNTKGVRKDEEEQAKKKE